MQLSDDFTLAELTKSDTAIRLGIINTPGDAEVAALQSVAKNILQPVRDHYGKGFAPTSGYRCLELNRKIGSKDSSQHVRGEAVDFEVPGIANIDLAEWIRDNLAFDQLILEFWKPDDPHAGWVHCSFADNNRGQVLTIGQAGTVHGLGR